MTTENSTPQPTETVLSESQVEHAADYLGMVLEEDKNLMIFTALLNRIESLSANPVEQSDRIRAIKRSLFVRSAAADDALTSFEARARQVG